MQNKTDRKRQKQDQNQCCDAHDGAPVVVGRHRSKKIDLHCGPRQKNAQRCKNPTDPAVIGRRSPRLLVSGGIQLASQLWQA
jgi:hypothetical protein